MNKQISTVVLLSTLLLSSCADDSDTDEVKMLSQEDETKIINETAESYAKERMLEEQKLLKQYLSEAKEKDKCIVDVYFTYNGNERIVNYVKQKDCDVNSVSQSNGDGMNGIGLVTAAIAGGVVGGLLASNLSPPNNSSYTKNISYADKEKEKRGGYIFFHNNARNIGASYGQSRVLTMRQNAIKLNSMRAAAKSAGSTSRASGISSGGRSVGG